MPATYICANCHHHTDTLTPLSGTLGRLSYTIPTCPVCSHALVRHDLAADCPECQEGR